MKFKLKSSKRLDDIMYIIQDFIAKKCSMIFSILPSKAEEGWIKPYPCQVDSIWLELTYYIETLVKTRVSVPKSSVGSKAKMTNFPSYIFPTLYWFSGRFSFTLEHIKNLVHRLFVLAKYRIFSLSIRSKMKILTQKNKQKRLIFYK